MKRPVPLILLFIPLWMFALDVAGAGERQLCQLEPGQNGEWHYRTKVDGKEPRCYYQGPRMKPRDELYWAETPAAPRIIDWEFESRWRGESE